MGEGGQPRAPIFTIGHSTRALDDFLALLARERIAHLVDVRTFPGSRKYPHFGKDALAAALATRGIRYTHAPALGGRRRPRPDSPNDAWRNEGFRGYADHMATPEFAAGLAALERDAADAPTAIMCSEAVPWRCHRSLIADALVTRGRTVLHILDGATSPHRLTRFAHVTGGTITYPKGDPDASPGELFER